MSTPEHPVPLPAQDQRVFVALAGMGGAREACSSLPSWTERAVSQNKQTTSGAEGSHKVPAGPLGCTRPIQPAPPGCVKNSENQSQAVCLQKGACGWEVPGDTCLLLGLPGPLDPEGFGTETDFQAIT